MIARENGMGRALSGTGGARSFVARSPTCCKSLRSSSLALRNSALSAREGATSAWRAHRIQDLLRGHVVPPGGYPSRGSSSCLSRTPHVVGKDS